MDKMPSVDNAFDDSLKEKIRIFWKQHAKFRHNPLITEQPNPKTLDLSNLAKTDIFKAIETLLHVDLDALDKLFFYVTKFKTLQESIKKTISSNRKILICGCGASGRLALALESAYAEKFKIHNVVKAIIAGGDNALVKSIEGFEDIGEYGVKQLHLAGFQDGDLIIGITASGDSPFVISALQEALKYSQTPWLLHCNTNESLIGRNADHIAKNKLLNTIELNVGPMALTGSTRMQAATVSLLAIGLPLFYENIEQTLNNLISYLRKINISNFGKIIKLESEIYKNKEFIFYETTPELAQTVLTDTTERAPTFNLPPFENFNDYCQIPSPSYLLLKSCNNSKEAWNKLLGRSPNTLDWNKSTSLEQLYGFDFSKNIIQKRESYASPFHIFNISLSKNILSFELEGSLFELAVDDFDLFSTQIILKVILNISSTLIMGRLGYYTGNLMTHLNPSNSKLIDRTIRYVDFTLTEKYGIRVDYNEIAKAIFIELPKLKPNESVVEKTTVSILNHKIL